MDQDKIGKLVAVAGSAEGLTEARRRAAKALGVSPATKSIKDGCAGVLSALMQFSGIDIPMTLGAGKLATRLGGPINSRKWQAISVGNQQPGDVGVTFDNNGKPGADHIYLVLQRVDADAMIIADNQDRVPHSRSASGAGRKTPTDYFLRATAGGATRAAARRYLRAEAPAPGQPSGLSDTVSTEIDAATIAAIVEAANNSPIITYEWKDRGRAPIRYIRGMAVAYGQRYRRLLANDTYVAEMAKDEGPASRDALVWYHDQFQTAGLPNGNTPAKRLRQLFVLMMGHGMRESSGRHCVGRDQSATNTTAETAEAGLFQTSWNARSASPLLPLLFQAYGGRTDLIELFKLTCSAANLQNFGSGDGRDFQKLSKECPAFAIDFAAIALRHIRKHWGPITTHAAEIRPDCNVLFRNVEQIVDSA